MKSVMQHNFSQVPSVQIPRSSFDRSHGVKTTMNSGYLVPFFIDEALPGDTFKCRTAGFCRLATPLFPVMDNMFFETFYFAVPMRLVWDNFQKFMGEQANPGDSTDYLVPVLDLAGTSVPANSLFDYFGIPTAVDDLTVSALYSRAYNLIWNTWFRDENLQDSIVVDKDDGPDDIADYVLMRRGKRHDYITSCLPWPQKGPAVDLPLGTTAPISGGVPIFGIGKSDQAYAQANVTVYDAAKMSGTTVYPHAAGPIGTGGGTGQDLYIAGTGATGAHPLIFGAFDSPDSTAVVDLSSATAATINSFRQALQIQTLYERDARGGTRYTELVRSHFGVISPDARLQRPEYLGGGSASINIHPVAVTTDTGSTPPSGALNAGGLRSFGTTSFVGHGFTKSFTEHTIILGLCNVRADITYQQGLNRMFSRRDRFDFYWPALAQIGEQAVLNKEIYAQGITADNDVFGYQERYAEYRYKPSIVTGEFRSNFAQPLDAWHLALDFGSLPVLSDTFIQDNPPIDRIVQDTADPQFICDFYHQLITARPMPLYGVPGSIMRF